MKAKLIVILVFLMLLGTVITISGTVINFDIKPISSINSKTLYVGGNGPNNYTHIQDAIDDAKDGDTVFVFDANSPYFGNLVVDKSISLIGENKTTTWIVGHFLYIVVHIIADNVKLNGFTITADNFDEDIINILIPGIKINNSDNCFIMNNIITDCIGYGLHIWKSNNCHISGNIINNNGNGIFVESDYEYTSECLIEDNVIKERNIGIDIVRIAGVVRIFNNSISECLWGITMWNIHESIMIKGNSILDNDIGIECEGHPQWKNHIVTLTVNVFSSNKCGVKIKNSGNTYIYKNNFENNIVNAYFVFNNFRYWNKNKWSYLLKGNYWDDLTRTGPKIIYGKIKLFDTFINDILKKDYIEIPWKAYDWFPSKTPFDI